MGSFQWCELWGFVNVIAAAGDASASCGERMTDRASRPQLDQRMRSLGVAQDEDVKERHVHIRSPFLCRRFFVSICCYADAMRDVWRDGGPGFINGVGSSVGTCLHSTQSDGQMRAKFRGRGLQRSHLSGISASFRGKTRLGRCLRFVRRDGAEGVNVQAGGCRGLTLRLGLGAERAQAGVGKG